jgi:hypothetical protein
LTHSDHERDEEEHDLMIRSITIDAFEQMMLTGVIRDASTLAAWGLYLIWKARHS